VENAVEGPSDPTVVELSQRLTRAVPSCALAVPATRGCAAWSALILLNAAVPLGRQYEVFCALQPATKGNPTGRVGLSPEGVGAADLRLCRF